MGLVACEKTALVDRGLLTPKPFQVSFPHEITPDQDVKIPQLQYIYRRRPSPRIAAVSRVR